MFVLYIVQRTTQISFILKVFVANLCHLRSEFSLFYLAALLLSVFCPVIRLAYQLLMAVTWWLQGQFRLYRFDLRTQASKQTANQVWFVRRCLLHAESWSELSRQRIFDGDFTAKSNLNPHKKLWEFLCVFNFLETQFRQILVSFRVKYCCFLLHFFHVPQPIKVFIHLMCLYKYLFQIHMQPSGSYCRGAQTFFSHSLWPNVLLFLIEPTSECISTSIIQPLQSFEPSV